MLNFHSSTGSWLASRESNWKGLHDGTALIASTLVRGLSQMIPSRDASLSAFDAPKIGLQFADGRFFFDSLPGGSGATSLSRGHDASSIWVRSNLANSVELIEERFPLRVESIGLRADSAGKGRHAGGLGLTKELLLMAPAKMTWTMEQERTRAQGSYGGSPGMPPELLIVIQDQSKAKSLKGHGELELREGDRIIMKSAGGGGWGTSDSTTSS